MRKNIIFAVLVAATLLPAGKASAQDHYGHVSAGPTLGHIRTLQGNYYAVGTYAGVSADLEQFAFSGSYEDYGAAFGKVLKGAGKESEAEIFCVDLGYHFPLAGNRVRLTPFLGGFAGTYSAGSGCTGSFGLTMGGSATWNFTGRWSVFATAKAWYTLLSDHGEPGCGMNGGESLKLGVMFDL